MKKEIKVLITKMIVLLASSSFEGISTQSIEATLLKGAIDQIHYLDSIESGWITKNRDDSELLGSTPELFSSLDRYDLFQKFNDRINHFYLNSTVYLSRDLPH